MKRDAVYEFAYFLLRVVSGATFLMHGGQKLFDWFGGSPGGHPELMSMAGIGGILELIGGACIVLGLAARPVAFILSGEMAVAFFKFHYPNPKGILPIQNGGDSAVLFCFIFLFFAAAGAGAWSLDAVLGPKKVRP